MTFHENLLQWCQICKTDHSTHHDVDSGSDAEDKDGVQVCEQVPLRGQDGEEEAGEGETGEIGDENIYCAGRPAEDHSEDQTAQLKIILGGLLCSALTRPALHSDSNYELFSLASSESSAIVHVYTGLIGNQLHRIE